MVLRANTFYRGWGGSGSTILVCCPPWATATCMNVSLRGSILSRLHALAHCFLHISLAGQRLSGIWDNARHAQDPEVNRLARSLPDVVRSAIAPRSLDPKYGGGWKRWQQWASSKPKVQEIPANPWYVAIFFNHVLHANGTPGA